MSNNGAIRVFADEVGVNPPIGGAETVQDALAAGGGSGSFVRTEFQTDTASTYPKVLGPFITSPGGVLVPPAAQLVLVTPLGEIGSGSAVVDQWEIGYPDFVAPALTDVNVWLHIDEPTHTNQAQITGTTIHQFAAGPVAAGVITVDFTTTPPNIGGADLVAAGPSITSTAGGTFSVFAAVEILLD